MNLNRNNLNWLKPRISLTPTFQIKEMVAFMFLLIIFIVGYGVSNQAITAPHRELTGANIGQLMYNITILPYWKMYGDLQLKG